MSQPKNFLMVQFLNDKSKLEQSGLRSTITYNTTTPITDSFRLNSYHSTKNLVCKEDDDFFILQQENKQLKAEVQKLRKQLQKEDDVQKNLIKDYQTKIDKLKQLVEKGYYSIRSLEVERHNALKEFSKMKSNNDGLLAKNKSLEELKGKLESQIASIKIQHDKEIKLVWERVAHVQNNLQAVVKLIEQDKHQQRKLKHSGVSNSRSFSRFPYP